MYRLSIAIVTMAISLAAATPVWAAGPTGGVKNPTAVWSAWGGDAEWKVHKIIPRDMQLQITTAPGVRQVDNKIFFKSLNLGSLEFHAPQGQFDNFIGGSLAFEVPMTFNRKGNVVSFQRLFVEANHDYYYPTLQLRDDQNRVLFTARQIHVYTVPAEQRLVMERMDIHMTEEMAILLGEPKFADQFLGELALNANLNIPAGAERQVRGGGCANRPQWPTDGFTADVGLTTMGSIQDVGTLSNGQGTFELVAPSSSLKNLLGAEGADVPWFRKFSGTFPPYNTDQHPYLVWNMYRVVDDRLEQIGVSGIKHAFLTINFNCTIDCGSGGVSGGNGHILWPGCEDVYGVGNNDSPGDIGPRGEVNPRTGVFNSTGSFFDQDGNGSQDNSSSAVGENRMQVLRQDLQTAGASYFFESWYVIRDDSNIFNSMGYRQITPTNNSGNSWSYPFGGFATGPVIDQWVPPGTNPNTGSQTVLIENQQLGHFKLAVKTQDLGNGDWRYTYMLMNFDVDHGITGLNIPVIGGNITDIIFHDPDQDAANDWAATSGASGFAFNAPGAEEMDWGTGYTFSFVVQGAAPIQRQLQVSFGPGAPQSVVTVNILAPENPDAILRDGFEG